MKKIITLIICLFITLMPLFNVGSSFVYAESSSSDEWQTISPDNETLLMRAAKSALQAMRFSYRYSLSGVITKWTYDELRRMCDSKGITMTELSENIKYKIDNNNKYQFLYETGFGETINSLWESMMESYGLTPNSFKKVYSGKLYTDPDGNQVQCFVTQNSLSSISANGLKTEFYDSYKYFGSQYLHSGYYYRGIDNVTYKYWNAQGNVLTNTIVLQDVTNTNYPGNTFRGFNSSRLLYSYNGFIQGYDCIVYNTSQNTYSIATFILFNAYDANNSWKGQYFRIQNVQQIYPNGNSDNLDIEANQGNENPLPTNKPFTIDEPDNDTDVPQVNPIEPAPTQKPVPPDSVVPNPNNPTVNPGNSNFNFTMPDINIDWNLGLDVNDLPFPFSIPFDFNNALKMLDVEPETPHFQGTVHVPYINYDWEIDLDFSEYQEYETLIEMFKKVFLFSYVISLIIATRAVMHIY